MAPELGQGKSNYQFSHGELRGGFSAVLKNRSFLPLALRGRRKPLSSIFVYAVELGQKPVLPGYRSHRLCQVREIRRGLAQQEFQQDFFCAYGNVHSEAGSRRRSLARGEGFRVLPVLQEHVCLISAPTCLDIPHD